MPKGQAPLSLCVDRAGLGLSVSHELMEMGLARHQSSQGRRNSTRTSWQVKKAGAPTGLVVIAPGPPLKSKHRPPTGDPANVLGFFAKLRPLKSQLPPEESLQLTHANQVVKWGGGGVGSMANSLSEKGPVDESSTSDERGGAWRNARSTTLNVELISHEWGMSTT